MTGGAPSSSGDVHRFTSALKWLGAGGGALIPGLSLFTNYQPPLFPAAGALASFLGASIIMAVFAYNPSTSEDAPGIPELVSKGLKLIGVGVICLVAYIVCLDQWSVLDPQSYEDRFQIGFGTSAWGLTAIGEQWKRDKPEGPAEVWMRGEGAFKPAGPLKLWQPKAIYTAGTTLIVLFLATFATWTLGFSLLAKNDSLSRNTLGTVPTTSSEKIMQLEDEQHELLGKFVEVHLSTPRESRGTFIATWPHNDPQATFFHSREQSLRFQGNMSDAEILAHAGLLLKSSGSSGSVTFSVLPQGIEVYQKRKGSITPLHAVSAEPHWEFEVFISHASEDKESIARPLYQALVAKGCKVWFDEAVLQLGDSLNRKINEGLSKCRYGVVILSPNFFQKEWPQKELDGLVARETISGDEAILPIWHKIDRSGVAAYSPTLADRVAAMSSEGVEAVAAKIFAVFDNESSVPANPGPATGALRRR